MLELLSCKIHQIRQEYFLQHIISLSGIICQVFVEPSDRFLTLELYFPM